MYRARPNNRKPSILYDNIDKQVLCIHKAIAQKLLDNHQYVQHVVNTIEQRYQSGRMRHGAYLFWFSLMEHIHEPELFLSTLLEDSFTVRQYRRQTPLVGILTEEERQQAIEQMFLY